MVTVYMILRLVHIIGGVFWVGGALVMNFFISPTLGATGEAGRQFAGHLMGKTRFSAFMTTSAYLSVSAGAILYGLDSNWFTSAWPLTGPGIGFGIGSLFGLIGLVTGIMNRNNSRAMGRIGAQLQGKPTSEQAATLAAIRKQQAWVVPANSWSLVLAVIFIVIARYLRF